MGHSVAHARDRRDTMSQRLAWQADFPFRVNIRGLALGMPCRDGIAKVAGAMMTPTYETNNLRIVTFTGSSIDFDHNPEERESGASLSEPPCLTHGLTQHMTATWGN